LTEEFPRHSFFQLFLWFWLPVVLYVAVIFGVSAQPNLAPPFGFAKADKVLHMLEYGGLSFLLSRALRATGRVRLAIRVALAVLAIGAVVGACDEVFQSFIPGRQSSVADWVADVTGLLFAQLIYLLFTHD